MLSKHLESLFLEILQSHTGKKTEIQQVTAVGGGSINHALRLVTGSGVWFAKYNSAERYPGMFEKEARGLNLLKQAGEIRVPTVVGHGEKNSQGMLVLEYVEPGRENASFRKDFGVSLARLHRHTDGKFGLDHNNFIGSLEQYNDRENIWPDFFIRNRLEVQIKMARDLGLADNTLVRAFESMYPFIEEFFPAEAPSLLHGDLWSGNYMVSSGGEACILDPAVYFGHRIMDIGMSKLFGGFSAAFYDAYRNEFPLENNWQQAVEIANLYPLMVHVNLFGAGYLGSVKSTLRRF